MADESFMKSLFGGVVAENVIFPYPEPSRGDAVSPLPVRSNPHDS